MKICLIVSTSYTFIQSVEEALRLSLEPWKLSEAVTYAQAEETLDVSPIQMVVIDEGSMPSSPMRFLTQNNGKYTATWFITVGCDRYPGINHLDPPLRRNSLAFFLQNRRGGEEQNDAMWAQQYMTNIYPILLQHIWTGLLNGWMRADRTMIMMAARSVNLPNLENMKLIPILVKTIRSVKPEVSDAEAEADHIYFHEMLNEQLLQDEHAGVALDRFSQKWAVLMYFDAFPCSTEEIIDRCTRCIEFAAQDNWSLSFYIGQLTLPEALRSCWSELESVADADIGYTSKVVQTDTASLRRKAPNPDMRGWRLLLEQGQCNEVYTGIREYIVTLAQQELIDTQWLTQFRDDFLLEIYHALFFHGIAANEILSEQTMGENFQRATANVQLLLWWLKLVLDNIAVALSPEQSDTIVKKAQKYILQNLDQELTREGIASHVFVSSGYLGRLFKKELRMNISEYIFQERMELAAKLLEQTDQYVTAIALQVGISNFPYFSTQFKKYSGYTPVEYRKQVRSQSGNFDTSEN